MRSGRDSQSVKRLDPADREAHAVYHPDGFATFPPGKAKREVSIAVRIRRLFHNVVLVLCGTVGHRGGESDCFGQWRRNRRSLRSTRPGLNGHANIILLVGRETIRSRCKLIVYFATHERDEGGSHWSLRIVLSDTLRPCACCPSGNPVSFLSIARVRHTTHSCGQSSAGVARILNILHRGSMPHKSDHHQLPRPRAYISKPACQNLSLNYQKKTADGR
ncbi:uncharacterized protein CC84DRAFT_1168206 [Paraphaeosphaeria sporulosa]|uniref:Uncharacterized protein n=1 Tax=Paraphaeosphaeria sporulosa TaxID=1460663 RepID=A0A177C2C4_9PLEO|nr:uncharacterized protein CC84DRAFT_1168206 [Paraphaeosphaeria sporulosa]OAG01012.1 hypothetical protein CC84DRAFT_1168206 [Paraphaeosphaeria sporulosa]